MSKKKVIIITGVSGFLGIALTKSLILNGFTIIGFTRNIKKKMGFYDENLILYENNFKNISKVFEKHPNILGIIHTATCYGRNNETLMEIVEANISYPLCFLQLSTKSNLKFFINTDTILDKYLNLYSMSKNQFLEWCHFFSKKSSIKFINIKLQHIYGPGDDVNKFTGFIFQKLNENVDKIDLTPGHQSRDFIFIDDVVNAYHVVLKNIKKFKNFDQLEVGTGKSIELRDFVIKAKKVFNSSTNLKFGALPYRKGEVMSTSCKSIKLRSLGWEPKFNLKDGLLLTKNRYYE